MGGTPQWDSGHLDLISFYRLPLSPCSSPLFPPLILTLGSTHTKVFKELIHCSDFSSLPQEGLRVLTNRDDSPGQVELDTMTLFSLISSLKFYRMHGLILCSTNTFFITRFGVFLVLTLSCLSS